MRDEREGAACRGGAPTDSVKDGGEGVHAGGACGRTGMVRPVGQRRGGRDVEASLPLGRRAGPGKVAAPAQVSANSPRISCR